MYGSVSGLCFIASKVLNLNRILKFIWLADAFTKLLRLMYEKKKKTIEAIT